MPRTKSIKQVIYLSKWSSAIIIQGWKFDDLEYDTEHINSQEMRHQKLNGTIMHYVTHDMTWVNKDVTLMCFREWVELEDFIHVFIAVSFDISGVISSQLYHQKCDKPDTGLTHGLFIHHDKEMPSFPGSILTTTLCGHSITEPSSTCSCMSRVDDDVNLSIFNWILLSNGPMQYKNNIFEIST